MPTQVTKNKNNLAKIKQILAKQDAVRKTLAKLRIYPDNNQVIRGKGFKISYAVAGSGPTGDETAIVYRKKFYILNGNWLKEYKPLVKRGYKACKAFFDSKKDKHLNFWSN